MTRLKVIAVGSSAGVVLPKPLLEKLRVSKGDVLFALETPGGIELTRYDPDLERQLEVAEGVMREDSEVLRRLSR